MTRDIAIRLATISDIPAILSIEALSKSVTWTAQNFSEELSKSNSINLIAENDGSAAGFLLSEYVIDECCIDTMAVAPFYRRYGIGKKLIESLFSIAKQRGIASIHLEVRAGNKPAISLYKSMGFCNRGVRKAYYNDTGEDGLLMYYKD